MRHQIVLCFLVIAKGSQTLFSRQGQWGCLQELQISKAHERLSKMDITEIKKGLEGNETLFDMSENIGLRRFVYNENGFYPDIKGKELPQYGVHNQYLEAIRGSVYFDSDYETCKEWLLSRFYTKEVLDVHVKFSIRC